ncbi:MAG: hypothetical protein ACYDG6_06945 [Thermincolia bacterium]
MIAASDEARKCPFLKPLMVKTEPGSIETIEQECMKERCEIWDNEEERCAIPALAKLVRQKQKRE